MANFEDLVFLGKNCTGGVHLDMKVRLVDVENFLTAEFDELPPEQKINPQTNRPLSFFEWCDIRQDHGCVQSGFWHAQGKAIDIDSNSNPYIATRMLKPTKSGLEVWYGGEQNGVPLSQAQREQAVLVYDRAMQFASATDSADVTGRGKEETTENVWNRFAIANGALCAYLGFAFKASGPAFVENRAPLAFGENSPINPIFNPILGAVSRTLLDGIPLTERRPKDESIGILTTFMGSEEFATAHPGWPNDVETQYYTILRDYELVRIPMLVGTPSLLPPLKTRNPVHGFLKIRKEIVRALCDIGGLRWGACDFGPDENGDIMHFDMGPRG